MPSKRDDTTPEGAVRLYLMYLSDPASLRDETEIKKLQGEVDKAKDPIDKIKALGALERAEAVDSSTFEEGFVSSAKAWAEGENVGLSAFRSIGVPDDVLRRAGFDMPSRGRGSGTRRQASGTRQRAKSVSLDSIKQHVRTTKGTFLLTDVQQGAGGSSATVRKAVEELIESGEVEKLGPVPNYSGRGRVPTQYSVSP